MSERDDVLALLRSSEPGAPEALKPRYAASIARLEAMTDEEYTQRQLSLEERDAKRASDHPRRATYRHWNRYL